MYFRLTTDEYYMPKVDYIFLYLGRYVKLPEAKERDLIYVVQDNSGDNMNWTNKILVVGVRWDKCELVEDIVLELLG